MAAAVRPSFLATSVVGAPAFASDLRVFSSAALQPLPSFGGRFAISCYSKHTQLVAGRPDHTRKRHVECCPNTGVTPAAHTSGHFFANLQQSVTCAAGGRHGAAQELRDSVEAHAAALPDADVVDAGGRPGRNDITRLHGQ